MPACAGMTSAGRGGNLIVRPLSGHPRGRVLSPASVVVAVDAIETGRVAEDHACLGEARFAAKVEPGGGGLREVARGEVMVDLLPLLRGHKSPGGTVHAPEALKVAFAVLAIGQGGLVDHQHLARRAMDCLKQAELAVG